MLDHCKIREALYLDKLLSLNILSINGLENFGVLKIRWVRDHTDEQKTDLEKCIFNYYQGEKLSVWKYTEIKEQLRFLKENFGKNGKYDEEDKAYFAFKKAERMEALFEDKEILIEENNNNKLIKYLNPFKTKTPITHFVNWLLEKVGGYGTKPWKVMVNMFYVVLIFFILFLGLFIKDDYNISFSRLLGINLYWEQSSNVYNGKKN